MLWDSRRVERESAFFLEPAPGQPAEAHLLLPATRILTVTGPAGDPLYEPGRDYHLDDSRRRLTLPPGSRIPSLPRQDLFPPRQPDSPPFTAALDQPDRVIYFGEDFRYLRRQVLITYDHDGWTGPLPSSPQGSLPRTAEHLRHGTLKLVAFGDSITAGDNATGSPDKGPDNLPYAQQLARELGRRHRAAVTLANVAKGGMAADWGLKNIHLVTDQSPDLVVLAWGMNDAYGRRPPEVFLNYIRQQIDAVRAAHPAKEIEFVLVGSMLANPHWQFNGGDTLPRYRDALRTLCGVGTILADVTTLWQWAVDRKDFWSLTGNGLNHPNDFGHTLYTDVLLATIEAALPRA
ncbi:MAG: SGNH/GDSL hydrolase family protein [Phycisphaeraceae bacterium]|nr:SGNH/GDSL hydrolase family protein [Phycisphaeraceae bacterium]